MVGGITARMVSVGVVDALKGSGTEVAGPVALSLRGAGGATGPLTCSLGPPDLPLRPVGPGGGLVGVTDA